MRRTPTLHLGGTGGGDDQTVEMAALGRKRRRFAETPGGGGGPAGTSPMSARCLAPPIKAAQRGRGLLLLRFLPSISVLTAGRPLNPGKRAGGRAGAPLLIRGHPSPLPAPPSFSPSPHSLSPSLLTAPFAYPSPCIAICRTASVRRSTARTGARWPGGGCVRSPGRRRRRRCSGR